MQSRHSPVLVVAEKQVPSESDEKNPALDTLAPLYPRAARRQQLLLAVLLDDDVLREAMCPGT